MSVSSTDKEARLLRVIDLLRAGTQDGSLEWEESFGNSYQTTLGGQSVVLEGMPNVSGIPGAAALEIRGRKGEVLERVGEPSSVKAVMSEALLPNRYSSKVIHAVDSLYELLVNRKEAVADAAIDNLLGALEGRVRAK